MGSSSTATFFKIPTENCAPFLDSFSSEVSFSSSSESANLGDMRSLHCVGFPQGTSWLDLHDWFSRYGNIECLRISRSLGAYICFENEANAEDAMRGLQNKKLEHGCKLRVEWTKGGCTRRHDDTPSKITPSKTLFVFSFDPKCDLKKYFKRYGTVLNVTICEEGHAYVDFARQEDATTALEAAHMSMLGAKVLKVDYKGTHKSVSQRERVVPRSPHYNSYRARRSRTPGSRSPHYTRNDNSRARRSRTPGSHSPHYSRNDSYRSRSPGSRRLHYSRNDSYRSRRSRSPGRKDKSRARRSCSPGSWSPHYSRKDKSRARRSCSRGSWSPHYSRKDKSRARRSCSPGSWSPHYSRNDKSRGRRSPGRH